MTHIAVSCGRTDLFAFYGDRSLPIAGWTEHGKAIVQKPDGSIGTASTVHVYDDDGNRLKLNSVGVR